MGLFQKQKTQPMKRNEIDNKVLKEEIADTALQLLVQGEDYGDLANTQVTFGYLFHFEDHGIEALFKIITDQSVAYFAVQGTQMMRLQFSEELFLMTVDTFLKQHGAPQGIIH